MNSFRLACMASLLAMALGVSPAHAQRKPKPEFQIKFATLAPEGSTWMKTMRAVDDELRKKTDNRLGFKFYPGGVQGDEKDVLRKIRNGQLHAGGFTGLGLGTVLPEVRVYELPYMFASFEELDYVRDEMHDYFVDAFDREGYLNLGWTDVGFVYILSKTPIRSPADMKAARMWVWAGDPLAQLFYSAFDVSPIPLSSPDVLTSLQTGIIDAVYGSPLAVVALQWYTRVNYLTDEAATHGLGAVLISKKALSKVKPEDIQILKDVATPRLRALTIKTRTQNEEAIEEMKKEGIKVVQLNDSERNEFIVRGRAAWGDGVGKLYSQELLDQVKAKLSAFRSRP